MRIFPVLPALALAFVFLPVSQVDARGFAAVSAAASKRIARSLGGLRGRMAPKDSIAAAGVAAAERETAARVRRDIDRAIVATLEQRWGAYISPARLQSAHRTPTKFLSREAYQARLKRLYPDLAPARRQGVVGDYRPGDIAIDKNDITVVRTLAHERLHQLTHPGFSARSHRLSEGATEWLASRVSGDLAIRGVPPAYPAEQRIMQMLSAHAGEARIARAYFQGDMQPLRSAVDSSVRRGALDDTLDLINRGDLAAAERVLRRLE